jgi:hypothetical protein
MKVSIRRERVKESGNIQRDVNGRNDEIETAGQFLQYAIMFRVVDVVGAQLTRFRLFAVTGREGMNFASSLVSKLQRHVAQAADADAIAIWPH